MTLPDHEQQSQQQGNQQVVSLQNLLQCGVVQVSSVPAGAQIVAQPVQVTAASGGQAVAVSQAGTVSTVQSAANQSGQPAQIQLLQIPGLSAPVTLSALSVNLPRDQKGQQVVQQQQQQVIQQKKLIQQQQQQQQMAVQMPNVIQVGLLCFLEFLMNILPTIILLVTLERI